jgi:hypothetical protein
MQQGYVWLLTQGVYQQRVMVKADGCASGVTES